MRKKIEREREDETIVSSLDPDPYLSRPKSFEKNYSSFERLFPHNFVIDFGNPSDQIKITISRLLTGKFAD